MAELFNNIMVLALIFMNCLALGIFIWFKFVFKKQYEKNKEA